MVRRACPRKSSIATLGMVILTGCTYVPEAVNPIAWYKNARDWLAGAESNTDSETQNADARTDARDSLRNEPFPDINTVPNRAPAMTSATQRQAIMAGLVADRTNARYSPETPPDYAPRTHTTHASSPPTPVPEEHKPSPPVPLPPITQTTPPPPAVGSVPMQPSPKESPLEEGTVVIGGASLPNPGATATDRKKEKEITPVTEGDDWRRETADLVQRPFSAGEEASLVLAFDNYSVGMPPAVYGTSYLVRSVPFASGSSTLSTEGRMKIRDVVTALRQQGGQQSRRMRVVGYASSDHRKSGIARKAADLRLSLERANAVVRELEQAGVETKEIMVSALTTAAALRGLPDLPRVDIYLDHGE